jgi:hypothetical protein
MIIFGNEVDAVKSLQVAQKSSKHEVHVISIQDHIHILDGFFLYKHIYFSLAFAQEHEAHLRGSRGLNRAITQRIFF